MPHHIQIVFPPWDSPYCYIYPGLLWLFCKTTKGDASSMSGPDYKRSTVQNSHSFFTAIKPSDIMNLLNPTDNSHGKENLSQKAVFFERFFYCKEYEKISNLSLPLFSIYPGSKFATFLGFFKFCLLLNFSWSTAKQFSCSCSPSVAEKII